MKTVIVVQARMTSTRLPGKVMMPLAGQPMLARMAERLRRATMTDELVIATTTNATDDVIAGLCLQQDLACYRGSEHDVLSRYAGAAQTHGADLVVRVTADCPLLDAELVDRMIATYKENACTCDYLSNMLEPTFPYGMAVEVFPNSILQAAHAEATQDAEREHVTPFIYWNPQRFRLMAFRHQTDLSRHRWTVDTAEDYALVKMLFDSLYPANPAFVMENVLGLLQEHPDWSGINRNIAQRLPTPAD